MRWKNRWIGVGLIVLAVIIGCGKEAPTGWEFAPGPLGKALDTAQASDSTTRYLANAGCALAPNSNAVGTVFLPVPTIGVRKFDCHSLSADSIHRVVRSYHQWVQTLQPGEHLLTWALYWDVGVVAELNCVDGKVSDNVPPNTNWQIVNAHGRILARGISASQGQTVVKANCNDWDEASRMVMAWGMNAGTPMAPQPTYPWDQAGDDGGSVPPPPDPEVPPSPISSIQVFPAVLAVAQGGVSLPFYATAINSDGEEVTRALTWDTDDHGIAIKDDDGTFVGVSPGYTTVRVKDTQGIVVGTALIEVLSVTSVEDSLCKASADAPPIFQGGMSPDSLRVPKISPMASKGLQQQISTRVPSGYQWEIGGYIGFNYRTDDFEVVEVPNGDSTQLCNYSPDSPIYPTMVHNGDSLKVVALWHSHPPQGLQYRAGDCVQLNSAGVMVDLSGEKSVLLPSEKDYQNGDTFAPVTNTNYVVQRDQAGGLNILRFGSLYDANGTTTRIGGYEQYWRAKGSNGCVIRKNG